MGVHTAKNPSLHQVPDKGNLRRKSCKNISVLKILLQILPAHLAKSIQAPLMLKILQKNQQSSLQMR